MVQPSTADALLARLATEQSSQRLPSLVAGLVRDFVPIWSGGRGRVDGDPTGVDVQYRIGSITKSFVAVLVMRLRDEGTLDLGDPLDRYVPGTALGSATIGQLLAHSSGLRAETAGPWWERTPGQSFDHLSAKTLGDGAALARPGRRFHYSNPGYGILGEIVTRACGMSWVDVLQRYVLKPLGMTRTTTRPQPPAATGFAVHPWADVLLPEPEHDAVSMGPAGQLWSTIADQSRFAAFLSGDTGDVLAADTLAEMREPQVVNDGRNEAWTAAYGLGLQLWNVGGRRFHGHSGSMPGYLAMLRVDSSTGDGVVVLTNATAGLGPELAPDLLRLLAEREPRTEPEWQPVHVPSDVLEIVGTWYWGPAPMGMRATGTELEPAPLGGPGRASRFRRNGQGRWIARDGYYTGEELRVIRRDDGAISHLDLGSFVLTRIPYDPAADVPGGVDRAGWGTDADRSTEG